MSRPGGRSNGTIKALNGGGPSFQQTPPGNPLGVSPTPEVEKFKMSRDGAIGNARIRTTTPVDKQPIARN